MKLSWKKGAAAIAVSTAIVMSLSSGASAAGGVNITVNGKSVLSDANHSLQGKTYVDLEAFSKATGVDFTYDAATKKATIQNQSVDVIVKDGHPTAYIRSLAQATGASGVAWNAATQTADVQFKNNLVLYGDVVSRNAGCVLQSRFTPGDAVVFRMKATNPITGELVKDAKIQVHLATGETIDLHLATHPPDNPNGDQFWSGVYEVTEDTPKGTLRYYVTAETENAKGQFEPFNMMPSLVTIVGADAAADQTPEAPATESSAK